MLFSVDKNGFEEILFVNLKTKETRMVAETDLGNYYPNIKGNKIVFSSMGLSGFDVYSFNINKLEKTSFKERHSGKKGPISRVLLSMKQKNKLIG